MKFFVKFFATVVCCSAVASAANITGFGSSSDFTFDAGFSSLTTYSANAADFSFTAGSGDFVVSGTLASSGAVSASGNIYLTATVTSYSFESSVFYIELYDQDFDYVRFQGSWAEFGTGTEHEYTLTYVSTNLTGGGAYSGNISAISLINGSSGAGSTSANISLNNLSTLSAIPEPSTYGLILGGVALGLVGGRRRRPLAA